MSASRASVPPHTSPGRAVRQFRDKRSKLRRRHRCRLVSGTSRAHGVLRGGPERPGERRGESLAAILVVRQSGHAVAPIAPSERAQQQIALGVVEEQEIDLMRVLVLHDAPGELTGVQQIGVEPDLAWQGARRFAVNDVNRDWTRNQGPSRTSSPRELQPRFRVLSSSRRRRCSSLQLRKPRSAV
jgi:hypothetical protein